MASEIDHIYKNKHQVLEYALKGLKDSQIMSERNREILEQWLDALSISGAKYLRKAKLLTQGMRLIQYFPCDLDKVTIKDVNKVLIYIESHKKWANNTKADYRRWIRQFYSWYETQDTRLRNKNLRSDDTATRNNAIEIQENTQDFYKYIHDGIKVGYIIPDIDPAEIITEEDLTVLIEKGCKFLRDKALISVLHQLGLRAGELLTIKIKHISFRDTGADIYVNGKTGPRTVPLMFTADLLRYLENHPKKDDPESWVWLGEGKHRNNPLTHGGATKIVREIFERAGIKKPHNLHFMRHSRCSILAQYMTEVVLCRFMGWAIGSKMVRTYYHGHSSHVREIQCKHYNLQQEVKTIVPLTCPSCKFLNESDKRYCGRCGRALTVSIALDDEKKKGDAISEAMEMFSKIMQDPNLRKKFEEYKQSTGGTK